MLDISLSGFRQTTKVSVLARLAALWTALWMTWEARLDRRSQLRALAALDDGALKDLGLSRADVEYWSEPPVRSTDQWMR
ncbi:MAG: DUF1127 domain-containing protein [Rhodospirillum sp.]|nr:DUF1127 domain-containing protein [Rhodospirillum sp.]MCF8487904.1 DUF1127 domain-containing protein [Rhodospirillum sp.]MCF8501456.1 DUF1127 domain-containing protein [Rhodospirillum sp.]